MAVEAAGADALGLIVPLAFASGVNLYATVAVLGLCSHYGLVSLPAQLRVFDNPIIITAAIGMCWSSSSPTRFPGSTRCGMRSTPSMRPLGGARRRDRARRGLSGGRRAGRPARRLDRIDDAPGEGGNAGGGEHLAQPFSNWMLSLGEDVLAVGISCGALQHPMAALGVAVVAPGRSSSCARR